MNDVEAARQRQPDLLLRVESLEVHYGGVQALSDVSLSVRRGEVVTVIGANGAGKSSLLNAIVGVVPARAKTLAYAGADIAGLTPEALVRRGVTLVPERRELFPGLTVDDNLRLGAYTRGGDDRGVRDDLARVYAIFPRLAERRRQRASTMSGGEQQMLAVGRAMLARPALLLLDEPSLGLAPLVVREIFHTVENLRKTGVTILLVEQNASRALAIADRGYVMESGVVTMNGDAKAMLSDPRVRAAYLGE